MGLLEDFGNRSTVNTKAQTLSSTKEEKLLTLFGSRGGPNVDTAPSLQQALSNAIDEQIYTSPSGQKYQEQYTKDAKGNTVITKVPYTETDKYGQLDTENLYIDSTKQGNYKLGLARTDKGFMGRYTPDASGYGWAPGPMGVTPQNGALLDVTLPRDVATNLEHNVHSNVGQIRNRAIGQGPVSAQDEAMFGSGKTEYTTPNAPMWNQNYRDPGTPLLRGTPMPGEGHTGARKTSTPHTDALMGGESNRLENLVDATQYGIGRKVAGIGDAIVDMGVKLGKDVYAKTKHMTPQQADKHLSKSLQGTFLEGTIDKTGNFTGWDKYKTAVEYGYDDSNTKAAMLDLGKAWEKGDKVGMAKSLFSAIGTAGPEFMLESAGEVLTAPLKAIGIGLNTADYTNQILDERYKNTGRHADAKEIAGATVAGIGMALLNKLGGDEILGNSSVVKNAMESIANTGSQKATLRAALDIGKKVSVAVGKGTYEGVEEVLQQIVQTVGEKYGTPAQDRILSSDTYKELFQAFGGGFAGGAATGGAAELPGVATGVKEGVNRTLDTLAEVSTGKTKEDVLAKSMKEQAGKEYSPEARESLDTLATQRAEVQAKIDALDIESPTYNQDRKDLGKEMADIKQQVSDVKTRAQEEAITTPEETPAATEAEAVKPGAEDAAVDHEATLKVYEENLTKQLKEQGVDQDTINTHVATLRDRFNKAGIANLTSLRDRASKVTVDVMDEVSPREVSKKKEQLFDPYTMDDTKVSQVINEGFDTKDQSTFLRRVAKKLGYSAKQHTEVQNMANHIEANMDKIQESMKGVLPQGTEVNTANVMRAVALGVNNVKSAMTSEADIADKQGIARKTNAARKPQLDIQIGKSYINSFGFKLGGRPEETAKAYQEMGNKIIQVMKDLGLVEEGTEALSAHNMVNKDGKPLTEESAREMGLRPMKDSKGKLLIEMPTLILKGDTDISTRRSKNAMAEALGTFSKLFTPPNMEVPQYGGQEFVAMSKGAEDVKISKKHEKVIKEYSELKYKIKPGFIQLLKDLKEMRDTKYDGDFDKMLYAKPEIKELLNLEDSKTEFLRMKESGRKINKTGNLARLLDNLDDLEGEFNFHYESAINERIHVLQTVLDYQGDKFMARQILTGGEYTTKSDKELQLLVEDVADALGVPSEDVLNPSGILKKAIASMDKRNGTLSLTDTLTVVKGMKSKTPFKTMSAVKALYDISKRDGNKVTTDYMVESDATASGVMNTLMNLAGYKGVQTLLRKLGVGKGADLSQKLDPYLIVNEYIDQVYSKENSLTYDEKIKPVMDKIVDVFVKDSNDDQSVSKFMRNLAKKPIMTWFYGQTGENTKTSMGNSIAVDLIDEAIKGNYKALNYINEITGKKYGPDNVDMKGNKIEFIGDIIKNGNDVKAMTDHFADTIGSMYVSSMETLFDDVQKYRKTMGDIYAILDNSKGWEGTIKSAMGTLTGSTEKMSIQKLKSLTMKDIDKEMIQVNKMMNNKTSFNVNLQHATDAALLLMTLKDVMKDKGIMTVHDAFYSDPATAALIMDKYNQYAVKAAMEYDYLTTAINEAEAVVAKMKDGVDKTKAMVKLADIRKEYEPIKASKDEYLSGVKTDVLGNNLWTGEEVAEEVQEATKDEKPAEHNERVYSSFKETVTRLREFIGKDNLVGALDVLENMNVSDTHKDLLGKVKDTILGHGIELKLGKEFNGGFNEIQVTETGLSDPTRDGTKLTPDTLVEILAHEVDHAIQFQWMTQNQKSNEMQYLKRVVSKLSTMTELDPYTQKRVDYILNPVEGKSEAATEVYQVAELVSVLSNETKVAEEILGKLDTSVKNNILQTIKKLIEKAYKAFSEMMKGKDVAELEINTETIMSAIQSIDDAAKVNTAVSTARGEFTNPTGITKATKEDIHKDIYMNPYKYANEVLAKQNQYVSGWMMIFGDTMAEYMGPTLGKVHDKAMRSSDVYRSTISLLRNGFITSDFAQRMHQTLGISGDSKTALLDKVQTLGTAMMQESVKTLENMAQLDRDVEKAYASKEDRVRVYKLFAKTGIANLQYDKDIYEGIMNGTMTVKDAMAKVSAVLDPSVIAHLDDVANYYITGKSVSGNTNTLKSGDFRNETKVYTTLKAISMITKGEKLLTEMNPDMRNELMGLALSVHALHMEINEQGMGISGKFHTGKAQYDNTFDGHYSMDIHEKMYEYRAVSKRDMKGSTYTSENEWRVIKEPTDTTMGLVARDSHNPGGVPGIGLELNKFSNGVYLNPQQSEEIIGKLEAMESNEAKTAWLNKNGMVKDGRRIKVNVDEQTKADMLSMKQNVAHSLYRTLVHNQELVQSEAIREIMLNEGTLQINNEEDMRAFAKKLTKNRQEGLRGEREEIHPFVKINYDYGNFDKLPRDVKLYFKSPRNLTTYNSFHKGITLVKRGEADVLLGHENFSLFGKSDNRNLAKAEAIFKKVVVLAKQKMIVTNPLKLLSDLASNIGILQMKDMTPFDVWDGFKDGWSAYNEFSTMRTDMVLLTVEARRAHANMQMNPKDATAVAAHKKAMDKLEAKEAEMKVHRFYDSFQAGFVQSYSTDMVIKEFDTISGVQKDINDVIDRMTTDKKGNPNAIHAAIKKWQAFGGDKLSLDSWMAAAGKSAKLKGTTVGDEMVAIAERLKSKKDAESVADYISNIIGAPSSEIVSYGGAAMVVTDVLSKYALANFLQGRRNPVTGKTYTKEEAYYEANQTFIDYRYNIPQEIKALSDYGILMFPAFWLKVQKVIASLVKYHPVNSLGGYAIESALGINGVNVLNEAFPMKLLDGSVIHDPTSTVGPESIFAFL